jgi:hypothetical protein
MLMLKLEQRERDDGPSPIKSNPVPEMTMIMTMMA